MAYKFVRDARVGDAGDAVGVAICKDVYWRIGPLDCLVRTWNLIDCIKLIHSRIPTSTFH